ncbi:MAG: hypothetical protein VKL60_05740 [Sphaerospermopsis sp.]|nr:hypothetical protein [Sphaerospermopsis sp.]
MSQFYEYKWPTTDDYTTVISILQKTITNTPLILDGVFANKFTNTVNFVDDFGIIPRVSFTLESSPASPITLIITGYQNGVLINETITMTTAEAQSNNCFDTVLQIIPTSEDVGIKIKIGIIESGYFPMILLNLSKINVGSINYALNAVAEGTIDCTVYLSLRNNLGLGKYDDLISPENGNFAQIDTFSSNALRQYNDLGANFLIRFASPDVSNFPRLKCQFLQL